MATTLELFFSGLMLLSLPEGDGDAVVVFPAEHEHQFNLVLLAGEHKGCGGWQGSPAVRRFSHPEDLVLAVEGGGGADVLSWTRGAVGKIPKEGENEYLDWLPSLSDLTWGMSRTRPACRNECEECDGASARFFIDRGRIAVCHLVHEIPNDRQCPPPVAKIAEASAVSVQLYSLPNERVTALADVISVRHELARDTVTLKIGEESPPCEIRAVDNKISLFVANTPRVQAATRDRDSMNHFRALHDFAKSFLARVNSKSPQRLTGETEEVDIGLLTCEDELTKAHAALNKKCDAEFLFAHSQTECGGGTQP